MPQSPIRGFICNACLYASFIIHPSIKARQHIRTWCETVQIKAPPYPRQSMTIDNGRLTMEEGVIASHAQLGVAIPKGTAMLSEIASSPPTADPRNDRVGKEIAALPTVTRNDKERRAYLD